MLEKRLNNLLKGITPVDTSILNKIRAHLNDLTKPKASLGRLEELAERYILITSELAPKIPEKAVFVFAADHGVTEEGVSAFPKEVTYQMVFNFLKGGAGINVLARHVGADVFVIDAGVDYDFDDIVNDYDNDKNNGKNKNVFISKKVAYGTNNMTKSPAMTRDEAIKGILNGIDMASYAKKRGYGLIATGEMGIGNTTAASAITSVVANLPVEEVTGHGTGIDDNALGHKVGVIKRAIAVNDPNGNDPIDILSKVGGHEIAAIAGLVLGSAIEKLPVVIDGFISTSGAAIASLISPVVTRYMIASHCSVEKGHKALLNLMGLRPLLNLDMRLGEGTGAALAMGLIDAGIKIYTEMATFSGAKVSPEL